MTRGQMRDQKGFFRIDIPGFPPTCAANGVGEDVKLAVGCGLGDEWVARLAIRRHRAHLHTTHFGRRSTHLVNKIGLRVLLSEHPFGQVVLDPLQNALAAILDGSAFSQAEAKYILTNNTPVSLCFWKSISVAIMWTLDSS